ncbi:vWA domain-containing protein [Chengkuizengella axinellae]|uniref:VWA domain-containing protein n=1 Tax=Chengkuizengella axinellae TaxID=3064388 RepID=A0ABT9J1S2_9BACL|nr:VWA domain-containing protein [Chengkuizengella sp. 2205SS18-9]MDP5275561.1 VWA domain-containing protein [Chengkuizengella sp. 2205SS18-9]
MRKIGFIVFSLFLIFAAIGCSSQSEKNMKKEGETTETAASDQAGSEDAEGSSSEPIMEAPSSSETSFVIESKESNSLYNNENIVISPSSQLEIEDMNFKGYGTNPFISTEDDPLSTFAIDVDTGSYTVTRNYIQRGVLPPPEAVRVEEFVNYFKSDSEAPKRNPFGIHVDGGESPFGEGYHLMRVAIKGKEIADENRKPANLVFVIDVSGSMEQENRLDLVKRSLQLLVEQLNDNDQVGIVVYGSHARTILEPTSIKNKNYILEAIDQLQSSGSTNAEEGLVLGYEIASDHFQSGAVNRVILCSDGVANVGETGPEGILEEIERYARNDITLSTFGFGMGNYNDVLMEQLADQGDGNYSYIDSFSEARRIFTEELTGTLQTIAKDVKIQVEFDPEKVDRYRLIGYENRDVRDEDFRDDSVDGGEIGAGHSVTALYEIKVKENQLDDIGIIKLRFWDTEVEDIIEVSKMLSIEGELYRELKFLAAVAEFAEILRDSYWARESSLLDVLKLAEENARGEKELEFVTLVKDVIAIQSSDH